MTFTSEGRGRGDRPESVLEGTDTCAGPSRGHDLGVTDTAETRHPTATTTPGFFAVLGAILMWSVGNVVIAGSPINGLALAFNRLWIAAIIFTAVLYATGGRLTRASFRYGWKGAVFFTADIATFYLAVKYTTLADATTISALQPALILFIAGSMFGERVRSATHRLHGHRHRGGPRRRPGLVDLG